MTSGTSGPDVAELVILTGMSGAGRSTAANVLEDLGWYVVDNLPPQMMLPMVTLTAAHSEEAIIKLAAVIDVRSRRFFTAFRESMESLRQVGWEPRVIFVDATDEALVRRFESVRRPHPLQGTGRMLDGIIHEREMLGDLRAEADVLIDTSGFKYGIPLDADLVFDMRFLPNPFWIPELRPLNGTEPAVSKYVMSRRGAKEFVDRVVELMAPMIDGYQREGRRYVTLAIGCTGGKHRSCLLYTSPSPRDGLLSRMPS